MLRLINLLRTSCCPGCEVDGLNSADAVIRRMKERYVDKYNAEVFILDAVQDAVRRAHQASLLLMSVTFSHKLGPFN